MSLYGQLVDVYLVENRNDSSSWANATLITTTNYAIPVASSQPSTSGWDYGVLYTANTFGPALQVLDGLSTDWLLSSLYYSQVPEWEGEEPFRVPTDYALPFDVDLYLPYYDNKCLFLRPHGKPINGRGIIILREQNTFDCGFASYGSAGVTRRYATPFSFVQAYTGSQAGSVYSRASMHLYVPFFYNNVIYTIYFTASNVTATNLTANRVYNESITASYYGDFFQDAQQDYVPVTPPSDPYSQGGESDTGGGTGTFDGTSVDVDFTSLPTLSAVDTGFITLYNPTNVQLKTLANYMWSGAFDLDTFKKLFADPMQAILGLSIVPGPVPSAGAQEVKVGNISTGINMTKAASQYIDIDCGTLNVEEFWGAYLDYEPYTKAEIYLPYIGTHQIAVDDIMGKAVHIKYHIDILSGACAAEIKCGGSVLYTFIGSVAVSIPVTGNDWTNVINGVLSIAGAVGSLVATGGAAAPAAAGEIASAAVNSLKPNIEKSGAVSGGGGLMAGKVPVLILTRPRQALPTSQNEFTGYPAFITRSLGAVSGYTEVHKIRLGGISATDAELDEIENLLKGGVIL